MTSGLIEIMENLRPGRIVLVGDFMLDRYIFGHIGRISPEAPVPVMHFQNEEYRLGGAGSVLANLAALGARVSAVGIVGDDDAGVQVRKRLEDHGADCSALLQVPGRPTVMKVRLLGSSQHRNPQQMIRLDIENAAPIDSDLAHRLIEKYEALLESADMVCIEDYHKGVMTIELTRHVIELARAKNIPVIIDPANLPDYSKYFGATALKLNRPEAERATGLAVRHPDQYPLAADWLLTKLELSAVIITLNEQGAYLATSDGERRWLQTRPRQVADATGAGDMVLAMIAVARLSGASWSDATQLANIAGGLEVERLGCVPVTATEVTHDLMAEMRHTDGKLRGLEPLMVELARHRAAGRKIVFTNGCFDLIHLGHIKNFQFAKAQGDLLVVAVNTDAGICRLKGDKRPIISEDDRIGVLEELESIDYLVKFDEDTPLELIERIRPDVLVKGADYKKEQVVGWDVVEEYGGRVSLAPLIDGRSTSNVIQRILDTHR